MSKKLRTAHMSYCLDLNVGRNEHVRDLLIAFLSGTKDQLLTHGIPLTTAERGRWDGSKILRIHTTQAEELYNWILLKFEMVRGFHDPEDFAVEIHETMTDAMRDMYYIPDYDTPAGHERFAL